MNDKMYDHFVCSECLTIGTYGVSPCMTCSNVCCWHLFESNRCFVCVDVSSDGWPEWSYRVEEK